ncbi:hypothetical protein [Streptomyces nigrescens]
MCTDLLHPAGPQRASATARRLRRAVALGAASVALLCCTAATGAAAESPGQKIADALRRSPVHVDPSLTSAVDAEQQRELLARIRRTQLPIRVALVPLVEGDSWGGKPEQLAEVVHDRMGGGPSLLITLGKYPEDIAAREWPLGAHQAFHAAAAVFFQKDMKGAGPAKRVARAIDLIEAGNGDTVYARATAGLGTPKPTQDTGNGAGAKAASAPGSPFARLLSLVVGPVLLLAAVGLLLRRRSRLRDLSIPFALPRSVFAAARQADEAGVA